MKASLARCFCALALTFLVILTIRAEPHDAMAWYERAVAEMGDLRVPLSREGLERGAAAIARAKSIGGITERECELIDAVAEFYHRHAERAHDERLVYYERALSRSRRAHPRDPVIARVHARASAIAFARARERVETAYARRWAD